MGQSNSPSENYLFLNVMVNSNIVNQKLTGSALHIEKNQTIRLLKKGTFRARQHVKRAHSARDDKQKAPFLASVISDGPMIDYNR